MNEYDNHMLTTRCKFLFQGESPETREMLHLCNYLFMESNAMQNLSHQIFHLDKIGEQSWTPPPANVIRIDVDGLV